MREILFRGKDKESGEWVFGNYVHLIDIEGKAADQHRIYKRISETELAEIEGCGRIFYPDYHIVDPETVGQFTGLEDKNGKEIFEGDILTCTILKKRVETGVVGFKWSSYVLSPQGYCLVNVSGVHGEIIGNIYDNKELCKKQ